MKEIIKFKNNVFEKIDVLPFANLIIIKNNISQIKNLLQDLKLIQENFGNYSSREVILIHAEKIPSKSARCLREILEMDNNIKYSTARFINFGNEDQIELEIILNFSKKALNNSINYIYNVAKLCNLILEKKMELSILTKKTTKIPEWITNFLKKHKLLKTKIARLIYSIQSWYKKLHLQKSGLGLSGNFIVTFSSQTTKNEFIRENGFLIIEDLTKFKVLTKISPKVNLGNVIRLSPNFKLNNNINITSSGFELPNLELAFQSAPTIAVLDSEIPDDSPFKSFIKVTNYIDNKKSAIHHGEATSSIAFYGDKLNGFNDGCGPFNVHLFEIFEKNLELSEFIKRIKMAVESQPSIKVWNLSINTTNLEAFKDGGITELAAVIDEIQDKYNVLFIQSSGNKESYDDDIIKSPADALKSLVVNANSNLRDHSDASYALNESSFFYTKKPDLAFFGGDFQSEIKALKNGKIVDVRGTSFAAPFVARKAAQLIYYENYDILETKALLIHASFVNSHNYESNKNGWGALPANIDEILYSKDHHIRFFFKEKVTNTKSKFMELKIPQKDLQKYSVLMTTISSEKIDQKYGCEYVRSVVNVNMGPVDKNNIIVPHRKLKPVNIIDDEGEPILNEPRLIKQYNKWKTVNCLKDIIKRERRGNVSKYGITTKIDKRMSEIESYESHNLVCIITLIHKDKIDNYNKFIEINSRNIVNIDQRIEGDIDIKNWD